MGLLSKAFSKIGIGFVGDILDIAGNSKNATKAANAQAVANAQNIAFQREANAQNRVDNQYFWDQGVKVAAHNADVAWARNVDASNRQHARELEAAQNAIQWRVRDAKVAGIHPLYAMGNPGIAVSGAPMMVGEASMPGSPGASSVAPQVQPELRQSFGADIGRAVLKTMTKEQRANQLQAEVAYQQDAMFKQQQLQQGDLTNELLKLQVIRAARELGPAAPESGTPARLASNPVSPQPSQPIMSDPAKAERQAGIINDYKYVRTQKGIAIVPSDDMKQSMEDSAILELPWLLRNGLGPNFNSKPFKPSPRQYPPPKGYRDWKWSVIDQMFVPVK